jgi:FliI/YscN family ATPase
MIKITGYIKAVDSSKIVVELPLATIGDVCTIKTRDNTILSALVIAFDESGVTLAPLGNTQGLTPGLTVENSQQTLKVTVSEQLIGETVDAFGKPVKQKTICYKRAQKISIMRDAPSYQERAELNTPFQTGITAVDLFCPLAKGQRVGLFAPPGVGKTTFIKQLVTQTSADVVVLALVGERGREAEEFTRFLSSREVGQRTIVVAATSDSSPMERRLAPYTATAIAEHFRDQGLDVLLLVDSLTRAIRAMREIGLASGELPIQEGLTPSIYAELPRLLERAGRTHAGSITALYSVLSSSNDDDGALIEELKSLLDGHIVLSQSLALRGVRPAVDILNSLSRVAEEISSSQMNTDRVFLIRLLARICKDKDLVMLGGIPDPELSVALAFEEEILSLLKQSFNAFEQQHNNSAHFAALASEGRRRLQELLGKEGEKDKLHMQNLLPN